MKVDWLVVGVQVANCFQHSGIVRFVADECEDVLDVRLISECVFENLSDRVQLLVLLLLRKSHLPMALS